MTSRGLKDVYRQEIGLAEQLPAETLFEAIQLNGIFEKGVADAYVPLYLIDDEEVAVDELHVQELAEQIRDRANTTGERGQLEHIFLGHIPGLNRLVIIDGFHRVAALAIANHKDALARILLNTTWEEVTDLRIETAREHKSVSFSREIAWIEYIWARTAWADKISAVQAFGLEQSTASTPGAYLKVTPEEVAAIKKWVQTKSGLWKLKASTIFNHLALASAADPNLSKLVRGGKGTWGTGAINQEQFRAIVSVLSGNFPLQQVAYEAVRKHRLTAEEASSLAWKIALTDSPEEADREVLNYLQSKSSPPKSKSHPEPRPHGEIYYSPPRPKVTGSILPSHSLPSQELLKKFFIDELELAHAALVVAVLRGRYTAPPSIDDGARPRLLPVLNTAGQHSTIIGTQNESWSDDKITRLENYFEGLRAQLIEQVSAGSRLDKEAAHSVVVTAVSRLLQDIREGGLRYVQFDDQTQINKVLARCIRDETRLHETRNSAMPSDRLRYENQNLVQLFAEDMPEAQVTQKVLIDIIRNNLPKLSQIERRILMLSTFFDLSAFAISQVLGQKVEIVEPALVRVSRKIREEVTKVGY